jgi:hypothetical protein
MAWVPSDVVDCFSDCGHWMLGHLIGDRRVDWAIEEGPNVEAHALAGSPGTDRCFFFGRAHGEEFGQAGAILVQGPERRNGLRSSTDPSLIT